MSRINELEQCLMLLQDQYDVLYAAGLSTKKVELWIELVRLELGMTVKKDIKKAG